MTTGERIKQLRKSLGLTQEELGEMIGVQKAAINKYETGLVSNLKQSTIQALSKALHVSPVVLLNGDEGDLSEGERRLIAAYRAADPAARRIALQTLENNPLSSKDY